MLFESKTVVYHFFQKIVENSQLQTLNHNLLLTHTHSKLKQQPKHHTENVFLALE